MARPVVYDRFGRAVVDNGLHWDPIRGRMVEGLEQSREELEAQEQILHAKINATLTRDRNMPPLKGSGFIVIVPSQPRDLVNVEEHEKVEDAEAEASDKAYQFGTAIIYAPIAVIRPKRDTVTSVPSKLMQQLEARKGLAAGGEVKEKKEG